jgi:hypothetical protein
MRNVRRSLEERFWDKVEVPDGSKLPYNRDGCCWNWTAAKTKGYGQVGDGNGKVLYAHRVSWELVYGPIKDGMWVLHKCDNPSCVNPMHLFLGSHDDNMRDMVSKLRGRSGRTVLTDDDVRKVHRLHRAGISNVDIAWILCVQQPAISKVLNGRTPRYAALKLVA